MVANILGYLGEYYSHIMISHGSSKMTHAAMQTPRAYVYNSSGDHWVLEDIQKSGPAGSTVNMGATYTYLYGQNEGTAEVVDYVDGGTGGATASAYLLNLPLCSSITDGSCRTTVDEGNRQRDIIGFRVAGVTYRHSYGVYTFVQDYDVHNGNYLSSPYGAVQCSSFQAMFLNQAGVTTVTPHAYTNAQVAPAVQGLYDIILEFASSAGANSSTSNALANQLANCFIDYSQCENQSSTPWQNFQASGTAYSISPDRMRGLGAHAGVNTPWTGATQAVQWNQAGSVYGCWTEDFRTWIEPAAWSGTGGTPPPPSCVPDCSGDQCGQDDGCGGSCATTDVAACGLCGNAACGGCEGIIAGNIGAAEGTGQSFTITGTDVTVSLAGGSGDGDLYVKLGSAPTTSDYDCRSWATGNTESCSVAGTGTFYILVQAYRTYSATTLTADVTSCDSAPPPTCTPACTGDQCGQADGCGGTCSSSDSATCGMCGNAACGGGGGGGTCSGLSESGLSGATGTEQVFTIDGTDVNVVLGGGAGDADVYVKLGSAPTQNSWDCRSWNTGNGESCSLTGTGTWYVMIHAYASFSGADLSASVASCSGGGGGGGGGTCSALSYSASGTSSASYSDPQTVQYSVDLSAGTTYTFSTCASGDDTYLRLHSGGVEVTSNDDNCGSGNYGSSFTYTPTTSGGFVLSLGCYSNTTCAATVDIAAAANSCTAM